MNDFKSALQSLNVNTNYLNLNTLHEFCGEDLIRIMKFPVNEGFEEIKILNAKYEKNLVILAFFRLCNCMYPHTIKYDKHKYSALSASILDHGNREIFILALKYFLDDDIIFLNTDAIYDESENYFSHMINSIRDNTYDVYYDDCLYVLKEMKPTQHIEIFRESNLMKYIRVWFYFFLAKTKSYNMKFLFQMSFRFIYSSSVEMYCWGAPRFLDCF